MCQIIGEVGPFWYLVSKKFYHHSVIFHFERLLRCETVKIWKIHWKLMIFKTQDCFANISSTIAPIFMKLQTNIHKIVKNDHKIFHNRSVHKRAHTRHKRARARFVAAKRARARLCLMCACLCTDLNEKSCDHSLLSYEYVSEVS